MGKGFWIFLILGIILIFWAGSRFIPWMWEAMERSVN